VASLAVRETRLARGVSYFFAIFLWAGIGIAVVANLLASPPHGPTWPLGVVIVAIFIAGGCFFFGLALYLRSIGPLRLAVASRGLVFSDGPNRHFMIKWPSGTWPLTVFDNRQGPVSSRALQGAVNRGFRYIPLTSDALDGILAVARESGLTITDGRADATKNSQDPGVHIYHNIRRENQR